MAERLREFQKKEVINLANGKRLGFVYDVEFNLDTGMMENLIVPCRNSIFRFFFKYEEIIISFAQIEKIGDDIILVNIR